MGQLDVGDLPPNVNSIVEALDEFQGNDIVVLHVGEVLGIVEYFVIASASNSRLVRKLAEEVEVRQKLDFNEPPLRVEGFDALQWVLLDYGDIVVHVMLDETRDIYELERLWTDVPKFELTTDS